MEYRAELEFMQKVLGKLRVQVRSLRLSEAPDHLIDFGLRTFLQKEDDYDRTFGEIISHSKENTIYRLTDRFMCKYTLLRFPDLPQPEALMIGPYMTFGISREQLLETAERFRIPAWCIHHLEEYYANVPCISDESPLFTMVNVFCERLWGSSGAFEIVDINQNSDGTAAIFPEKREGEDPEAIMLRMKMLESRYAYENELMDMVAQGLSHRAELMLTSFSGLTIELRTADPVRNIKNYSIICNTIMRKAAEQGGVHPVYLDSASAEFARKIEMLSDQNAGQELMIEMVHAYCRLVRKHSTQRYSPIVQKAVAYIEADLAGDLSLRALAAAQNVNASYLSALFRKETGKTVTEYVNEKRMESAARLLRTTRLQVQTIAQHCGMSDVNYFSKIFKKHHGMTPKQFREENRPYLPKT